MKIISKYKDYYDYLSGIYGEDPKLILDRREKEMYTLSNNSKIKIYIADYIIEGLYKDNKFYFGQSLQSFIIKDNVNKFRKKWLSKYELRDYDKSVHIKSGETEFWAYLEPEKDILKINSKEQCPILIKDCYAFKKYPKLSDFKLGSFLSADNIYKILSEWLGLQITLKEQQSIVTSDILKLKSKGFDEKRSFRPKMK